MFFGNVWQKIAQILLCVCIVSTLVNCQGVTGEAGGAVGENAGNIRDRERVCKATQDAFEADMTDDEDKLFTRWVEIVRPLRSWRGYLNKKPSTRKLILSFRLYPCTVTTLGTYSSNLLKVLLPCITSRVTGIKCAL